MIVNYFIQKAGESDFPQIVELFKEFSIFQNMPEKMENSLERLQQEQEFFNCFIAKNNNSQVVGYATWFYGYFTWSGKSIYMDDLYVKPEFRGKGIGSRLMQEVIAQGKSAGCHKLRWQVSHWNSQAIAFYTRMGAEIDQIEQNCDLWLDR